MNPASRLHAGLVVLAFAALPTLASAQTAPVRLPDSVPFAPDAIIKQAIRTDCDLPNYTARVLADQFRAQGVPTAAGAGGDELQMEIVDAVSTGNAFIGHHKSVRIKGKLVRQGQVVASFIGERNSMGGALAGFKGSCTVVQRCADALAQDIAAWARAPAMNAQLGDLR